MTDIVERLYEMADDITPELAAEEITRLRAEIVVLRADLAKAHLDLVAWIKKAQETYR